MAMIMADWYLATKKGENQMNTRQYIGARYVPKFFDFENSSEWRSGFAYEPLTIVTRNGNSYTSKIPVPSNIGAPESNPQYWASTGIYNSQVEQYREEVEGVIADLEDEVSDRADADDALSGRIDAEVTARQSADTALTNAVNSLKNPRQGNKFLLIGDSYNSDIHYSWGAKFITYLGLTEGTNVWNYALPGAGFGTGASNSFLTALQTAGTGLTAEQKLGITHIIIQGGVNDWNSTSEDIRAGVGACEAYVMANFPNARIWIICAGWSYQNDTIRGETLRAYNQYSNSAKISAVMHDAYAMFLTPYALDEDMTHPTDTSTTRLARMIINFIWGGNLFFWRYTALRATFGNLTINGNITPNGTHVYNTAYSYLAFNPAISITSQTPTIIASHSGLSNQNFFMRKAEFPGTAIVQYTGADNRIAYANINCVYVVEKQQNNLTWDLKIMNRSVIDGSFTINNILRIYPLFDAMIDPDKT